MNIFYGILFKIISFMYKKIMFVLEKLGYRLTIKKIYVSKLDYMSIENNSELKNMGSALVYLSIGDDSIDFVINSVKSFRKFNRSVDVIIFTNDPSPFLRQFINEKGIEVKDLNSSDTFNRNYIDINDSSFRYVTKYKWQIILSTLNYGYEWVLYSDIDVVFTGDVFKYFTSVSDQYKIFLQSESQENYPPTLCAGFMMFKFDSIKIVENIATIFEKKISRIRSDQRILNDYVYNNALIEEMIFVLPEAIFPNGLNWKNLLPLEYLKSLTVFNGGPKNLIFHANFTVGLDEKKDMLTMLNLWFN